MIRFSLAAALLLTAVAAAQEVERHPYDIAREEFGKTVAGWKQEYAGRDDVLVLEGVLADRKAQSVTVLAVATSLSGSDPVEFFLTPLDSGKDYESLAVTFAKPSDVHKALEFIGLKPGRPVNFNTNHLWPRGPRVAMEFDSGGKKRRVEDLVVSGQQETPLPRTGMLFTGSYTFKDEQGITQYAADEAEAKVIAPNYNDPTAVLDLPRRALQSEVYGFQRANPEQLLKFGETIRILLTPAADEEAVQTRDLQIAVRQRDGRPAFEISENGKTLASAANLPEMVAALAEQAKSRDDLFTTVTFDPAVLVKDVRTTFAVLQSLEQDRRIKLEPSPANQLFYRAFFPDEQWRVREERLGEPWELFLSRQENKLIGRLERQVENFEAGAPQRVQLQRFETPAPEVLSRVVADNVSQWSKAIFIYPPADITYGELMTWAGPVADQNPRIFIFPAVNDGTTQPAK